MVLSASNCDLADRRTQEGQRVGAPMNEPMRNLHLFLLLTRANARVCLHTSEPALVVVPAHLCDIIIVPSGDYDEDDDDDSSDSQPEPAVPLKTASQDSKAAMRAASAVRKLREMQAQQGLESPSKRLDVLAGGATEQRR